MCLRSFTAGTVPGIVAIKPSMLTFKYECFCNDVKIEPCHTKKKGAIDVDPVDVAVVNPKGVSVADSVPRRTSSIGWSAESLEDTSFEVPPPTEEKSDDEEEDEEMKQLPPSESKSDDDEYESESKESFTQPARKVRVSKS